jgi:hypothetical protein
MRLSFKQIGFAVGLIAASALTASSDPALARKAIHLRQQPPSLRYRLSDLGTDCVERSRSVSVGNPADRGQLAIWPAPCY